MLDEILALRVGCRWADGPLLSLLGARWVVFDGLDRVEVEAMASSLDDNP